MQHADTPSSGTHGSAEETLSVDVLIVGGGFVGGALACALSDAELRVAVVDSADPAHLLNAGFDGRASAIALSSRRFLEGIGVWPLAKADACPMMDIRVSDGASPLYLHYDHNAVGDEPFGHMVENRVLRRAVWERMDQQPGVMALAPSRIVTLDRRAGRVVARLADGRRIVAPLVVAADGRGSTTRDDAGVRVFGWPYRQVGIVCTVAHERPHDYVAHEHFLPAGPFAILPLNGNRSSIVWTETASLGPAIMALDEAAFIDELATRFGDFLGELRLEGPRWCYPLSLQFAETQVAHRLALAGDAAHAMHPIAGQGLNMGFRDAAALAEVLADARRLGLDLGGKDVLDRYQRWRRFDNMTMLAMTDGLNRLFSNNIGPIRLARDVGLATVNRLPRLKRTFMRHAMGVVGTLPRLMRGEAI